MNEFAFDVFVLPTGMDWKEGNLHLEATLALRPTILVDKNFDDNKPVEEFDQLRRWPEFVKKEILPNFQLTLRRADGGGALPSGKKHNRLDNWYEGKVDGVSIAEASAKLWRRAFSDPGTGEPTYQGLIRTLARPQERPLPKLLKETKQPDLPGEANKDGSPAPDIISVSQAELAHLLTLNRANIIHDRIVAAKDDSRRPKPLAVRTPSGTNSAWTAKVNEGFDPAQAFLPGGTRAKASPEDLANMADRTQEKLADELRKEDESLRRALQNSLLGPRNDARMTALAYSATDGTCQSIMAARQDMFKGSGLTNAAQVVGKPDDFNSKREKRLAAHVAATLLEPDLPEKAENAVALKDIAGTRWAMVMGIPSLQRALHLAVDIDAHFSGVEFDEKRPFYNVEFALDGAPVGVPVETRPTLVKIKREGDDWSVWPCTREEAALGPDCKAVSGVVDQIDGLLNLESRLELDGTTLHRFAIDSLDVHAACEAEVQRDRAVAAAVQAKLKNSGYIKDDLVGKASAERKLRTAGVQIFDQWRSTTAIKQFVSAMPVRDNNRVLDAEDLTVGVALDIGFSDEREAIEWTSLTQRKVVYSKAQEVAPGDVINLQALVDLFCRKGVNRSETRVSLDSVIIAVPARLVNVKPSMDADGRAAEMTAFQETSVAVWDGDPLGVRCHRQSVEAPIKALQIDLTFDLPRQGDGIALPPVLKFGSPYWLGGRTVMLGGVKRLLQKDKNRKSLRSAEDQYNDDFALPGKNEYRRYLRHEWIDAPMVATPWPHIAREFGGTRRGLEGETLVVRSLALGECGEKDRDDDKRFAPHFTERVLFAPAVDFTFAQHHGVFDGPHRVDPNVGGLAEIDYDRARGGFPSFATSLPPLRNYIRYDKPEALPTLGLVAPGDLESEKKKISPPARSGLAVFRRRKVSPGEKSEDHYFPDPAARHMIFALRQPWAGGAYLEGQPIKIPLYPHAAPRPGPTTSGFPHAAPVVVRVEALQRGHHGPLTNYGQLASRRGVKSAFEVRSEFGEVGERVRTPVQVLTLPLLPGEDFDLIVWAAPDPEHVGAWFDTPESLALLSGALCRLAEDGKVSAPPESLAKLAQCPAHPKVVRREEATIPLTAVGAAARLIHKTTMITPIPEFAAPRRMRVTHACERPASAPEIVAPAACGYEPDARAREVVPMRRVNKTSRDEILKDITATLGARADDADANSLLVDAWHRVDLDSVDAVELRVTASAPNGRPLDDVRLGRSEEYRVRGIWPAYGPGSSGASPSRRLYGFDVFKDGSVRFPEDTVVMQRWKLRPDEKEREKDSPYATLSLLDLTRRAEAPDSKRVFSDEQLFSDGGARRVQARIYASSRTAHMIPEREAYRDARQKAIDDDRRFLPSANRGQEAPPASSIIRSIVRPAVLPRLSILPAFVWTEPRLPRANVPALSRSTRIRIPFSRPAMTSGVEERIGIVIWPPNILAAGLETGGGRWDLRHLGEGTIRRSEPAGSAQAVIKLNEAPKSAQHPEADWRNSFFNDLDLGPGGEYVTRWGADPIHPEGELGWLIGLDAFVDCDDWSKTAIDSIDAEDRDSGALWDPGDIYKPRLVENVLMPIPKNKLSDDKGEQRGNDKDKDKLHATETKSAGKADDVEYMMVSLLSYAPRFDVDSENWYIDVDVDPGASPDPFIRFGLVRFQPHAARELQVSYPMKEWAQIVSRRRDATVEVETTKDGSREVVVTIASPLIDVWDGDASDIRHVVTTMPAQDPYKDDKYKAAIAKAPVRRMRATLIERTTTDEGLIFERPARIAKEGAEPCVVEREVDNVRFGTTLEADWTGVATLRLPLPAQKNKEAGEAWSVDYAVYVEEYLSMKAASQSAEPIKPGDEERRDSGPRYAIKLAVPAA